MSENLFNMTCVALKDHPVSCRCNSQKDVPWKDFKKQDAKLKELVAKKLPSKFYTWFILVYIICRRGNDSQYAIDYLKSMDPDVLVKDIIGGFQAWSQFVDDQFPLY